MMKVELTLADLDTLNDAAAYFRRMANKANDSGIAWLRRDHADRADRLKAIVEEARESEEE